MLGIDGGLLKPATSDRSAIFTSWYPGLNLKFKSRFFSAGNPKVPNW
jgi:hypothetical protein